MSNDVAVQQSQSLLSEADLAILRKTKFKGFSEEDILSCAKIANTLQLSPFLNQIHFIKRKNWKDGGESITAQVGIDGFRLAAQRSGGYAGQDEASYEYEPTDTAKKDPTKASVTVYKIVQGVRCAFTASARWCEYYPGKNAMWDKLQHTMLAKCAEALALRKAFPAELSGVYAKEEMDQASDRPPSIRPEAPGPEDGYERPAGSLYRIGGGTHAQRMLREIDLGVLRTYHDKLEAAIEAGRKVKPEWWDEFSREACRFIAAAENATHNNGDEAF